MSEPVCVACAKGDRSISGLFCSSKCQSRFNHLNKLYGMLPSQYLTMYEDQNGCCAICSLWYEQLNIDHDHKTGQVRALLCRNCNTGLGMFKDDPRRLAAALVYLEDH